MQGFPFDSQLTYDPETGDPIYDRAVSSQPLRTLIRDLFTTGVMPNPSTNLQVSAGTDGMTVQVDAGFAVIDGGLCQESDVRTLEVTAADDTYDRIDTVVVRWNENVDVRRADLYIVAGTPAANPVRPELQRDNSIYEIGLADVFVTRRVATITNDKITDTRYEASRCGIVSSVSEWDTTTIYQQVQADLAGFKSEEQAEFLTWFETIQDILDENVAAHLQSEIDNLNASAISFDDTTAQIGSNDVQGAIEGLKSAFSSALTALKATPIAQAVGATVSDNFAQVIAKLDTIVNRGKVTQTLNTSTKSYTIPAGYHNGQGTVSIATQEKTVTGSRSNQTVTPDSGKVLSKVTVNKYPDASGTYGTITTNGTKDMGATNNYRYCAVNVPQTPYTREYYLTTPSNGVLHLKVTKHFPTGDQVIFDANVDVASNPYDDVYFRTSRLANSRWYYIFRIIRKTNGSYDGYDGPEQILWATNAVGSAVSFSVPTID